MIFKQARNNFPYEIAITNLLFQRKRKNRPVKGGFAEKSYLIGR